MEVTWFPVNHPVPSIQGTWYKQLTQFCYTGRNNHPQKLSLSISFYKYFKTKNRCSCVFNEYYWGGVLHQLTYFDKDFWLELDIIRWIVHWFSQSQRRPLRRPRYCLKPMNRLQLYPSSFKKTDLYSIMYNWQFEGKPSCEASYCKILVINNPIKHNRGVQSSVAARPKPGQPPPPRPAPVEAIQSSLSFSVPVTAAAI